MLIAIITLINSMTCVTLYTESMYETLNNPIVQHVDFYDNLLAVPEGNYNLYVVDNFNFYCK